MMQPVVTQPVVMVAQPAIAQATVTMANPVSQDSIPHTSMGQDSIPPTSIPAAQAVPERQMTVNVPAGVMPGQVFLVQAPNLQQVQVSRTARTPRWLCCS